MESRSVLIDHSKKLFKISQLVQKGLIDLDDLAAIIPGFLHLNSRQNLAIEYISKRGCELAKYSSEELIRFGVSIFEKHQSKYAINHMYPKIIEEFAKNDEGFVLPFFQDWRHNPDEKPFYFFTSTRILNENQLISISTVPQEIEKLCRQVNRVFGVNKILEIYYAEYYSLTKREKEILDLLGKEMSRKEISIFLFIDSKTVKKHCENIFRKLGTNKRTEIEHIAFAFSAF